VGVVFVPSPNKRLSGSYRRAPIAQIFRNYVHSTYMYYIRTTLILYTLTIIIITIRHKAASSTTAGPQK